MDQTKSRQLLAAVKDEIAGLKCLDPVTTVTIDLAPLEMAFSKLSSHLALGPEPETRACPACGGLGMRSATICRYCWAKTPPPERKSSNQQ
jgi:hypothetical protein